MKGSALFAWRGAPSPVAGLWRQASGWREFFDRLSDPILVFDARARVSFANTAALRLVPCEAGTPVARLEGSLGRDAVLWLAEAAIGEPAAAPPMARLSGGREAALAWQRLDDRHGALRLVLPTEPRRHADVRAPVEAAPAPLRETLQLFWDSPFPATLQDASFRFVDVNPAFAEFTGRSREELVGSDFLDLVPAADRDVVRANRQRLVDSGGQVQNAYIPEGRLLDAGGVEHWFRAGRHAFGGDDGAPLYLAVLQDTTSEHVARERADHSVRELDDWFELSPIGMVLFDDSGLLVRTNSTFDEIAGNVPVSLAEGDPGMVRLLGWGESGDLARLRPGSRPIETQGWVAQPGGAMRRLRAIVRCYETAGGKRRYMAIVEDRSIEEERDLAQMQIGALMDTAGVGVATFEESTGWVRQRQGASAGSSAVLQNIGRDIVVAESLPEFERLQLALKRTERAEVRYAIRHPELGQRWLLSRVEPATLVSGKRTASVVTLDVTDQHQSQRRSEQLLREMTTILESTAAGIAYLREGVLVRCNHRFEAMLRLSASGVAGLGLGELLSRHPHADLMAAEIGDALKTEESYELEFALPDGEVEGDGKDGAAREEGAAVGLRWYSLSVRKAGGTATGDESIAVLSDVTRLKTQQAELETLARDRELMFSLSDVGIAFVRDGRIQRANAALASLTGWPVGELSALDLSLLFEADDGERQRAQDDRDLRLHGRCGGERQMRRRDGRLTWVQMAMRLVNRGDPAGGIIASYVNVDARHRAERAVALQAERTRSILDSVLVGIVTVGPSGIEWMNRSARRMFAGSLADFV
ncbi:MAG: PAS domain S-box protein, partial [Caldimonas sp.]